MRNRCLVAAIVLGLTCLSAGCDKASSVTVVNDPDVIRNASEIFGPAIDLNPSPVTSADPAGVNPTASDPLSQEPGPETSATPSPDTTKAAAPARMPYDEAAINAIIEGIVASTDFTALAQDFPDSYEFRNDGIRRVCIDAGHQGKGVVYGDVSKREPVGPNAVLNPDNPRENTNPQVAYGAEGVSTKAAESELVLEVALKLEQELKDRGYEVVMVRRSEDVFITNAQRALIGNKTDCDISLHIHMDSFEDSTGKYNPDTVGGAHCMYTTAENEFVPYLSDYNYALADYVINAYCNATGYRLRTGNSERDGMSALNWSSIPTTLIEMGFLSNHAEDEEMNTEEFQLKAARAIADGIDQYFDYMENRE